jgi:hypothetical protein
MYPKSVPVVFLPLNLLTYSLDAVYGSAECVILKQQIYYYYYYYYYLLVLICAVVTDGVCRNYQSVEM